MEDDVVAGWNLPSGVITKILEKVTPKSAARCCCVAKTWNHSAESPRLRRKIGREHFLRFGGTEPTILREGSESVDVYCVAKRDDLIALGGEEQIRVWNMGNESISHFNAVKGRQIVTLCFIDELLFSGDSDGHLIGWDVKTRVRVLDLKTHTGLVMAIASLEDTIACGGGYNTDIKLIKKEGWRGQDLSEQVLEGHTQNVECLVALPKEKMLVSGSGDATIRLWKITSKECLTVLCGHGAAVLSLTKQDGLLLSGSLDSRVHLWHLDSLGYYRPLITLRDAVCLDTNGDKVASGSSLGHVSVWDIEEEICLRTVKVGTRTVGLWLEEGKLLGASENGHIYMWDFSP